MPVSQIEPVKDDADVQKLFFRIHQIASHWANKTPNRPALSQGSVTWNYRQLEEATAVAVEFLSGLGVVEGDRVMLVGENCNALVALIFAAGRLSASAVLENARRSAVEVEKIIMHADPCRILYLVGNSPNAREHAEQAGSSYTSVSFLGDIGFGAHRVDAIPDPVHGDAADTAIHIYTTGTTGAPKGVMLTHANLLSLSSISLRWREMRASDRVYCVLPITHVMGLAVVLGGTIRAGGHLFLVARFDVAHCASALKNDGVTVLQGAPAMFAKLIEHSVTSPIRAPNIRLISVGGAPLVPALKTQAEALFDRCLHNGYGLTEAASICVTRLDAPRDDASVGQPVPGVEVKFVDSQGKAVSAGTVGELWVRGPQVLKGYFRDPVVTSKVLTLDGWFNTEDLGYEDEYSNVFITGRTKDLIISGGFNVQPLEVEEALNAHPAIVHSAVMGRAGASGEYIVAFIEVLEGSNLHLAEIHQFLSQRLSPYKRPREIYEVDSLPCAPNGKIIKRHLIDILDGVHPIKKLA
jgi:acyl-CoA synthetase (AMP-forming)/AMP-acid ligase II